MLPGGWGITGVCTKPRPSLQPRAMVSLCCRLHQLSVWASRHGHVFRSRTWAPSSSGPPRRLGCTKACANEGRRAGGPLAWHGMGKLVPGGITDPCGGGGTGSGLGIGIGKLDGMTGGICAGVEGPQPCNGGCCCGGASCASVSQRKQACRVTH
jgi:hypothetical protein